MPYGKASVIVPTYNRGYCLAAALNGLQRQSYRNWEALVIDDGSSDETAALVESLGKADPRIRYQYQANRGVSSARNAGLRMAGGEWIAFLDSDDAWEPWKLGAQIECLVRLPEVGMICTDMNAVDERGRVVSNRHLRKMYGAYSRFENRRLFERELPLSEIVADETKLPRELGSVTVRWGDIYSAMIVGALVHTSTVLLRRSRADAVGFFNEGMRTGEDYQFHLRVCRAGPVALLDTPCVRYRIAGGGDQLTAVQHRVEIARNALNTRLEAIALDRSRIALSNRELRQIIAGANEWLGAELFDAGQYASARGHLWRGIRTAWSRPRWMAKALLSLLPQRLARSVVNFLRVASASWRPNNTDSPA